MNKYASIQNSVFAVFATTSWKSKNIPTFPDNFVPGEHTEFMRVSVLPSGAGVNYLSASGVLIAEIFTEAGKGPSRYAAIADTLDSYLQAKLFKVVADSNVQFGSSVLQVQGIDSDNPSLYRVSYTIPFNYFEVNK